MNWRRGLVRLLIVLAVGYWALALITAYNAFQAAPAPAGHHTLKSLDGRYYSIDIDGGGSCESAIQGIAADLRKPPEKAFLEPNACARSTANAAHLRRRDGLRAARSALVDWGTAFLWIAGVLAALWWIVSGFANKAPAGKSTDGL